MFVFDVFDMHNLNIVEVSWEDSIALYISWLSKKVTENICIHYLNFLCTFFKYFCAL